jgi:hypothetical protein
MPYPIEKFGSSAPRERYVDPREIIISPEFNYRDMKSEATRKHIEWLKSSIKVKGVTEACAVRIEGGKMLCVDGECRITATIELFHEGFSIDYGDGVQGPPKVKVHEVKGSPADYIMYAMTANSGSTPSKIEFGNAAQRLQALGVPEEVIIKQIPSHLHLEGAAGKRYIDDAIELYSAPKEVHMALQEGEGGTKVSEGLALHAVRESKAKPVQAMDVIRREVAKAKAANKPVARRPKAEAEAGLRGAIKKLLKGVKEKDLRSAEFEYIEVDRALLLGIYEMLTPSKQ